MKQKLITFLMALLCASGVWATEYTVTYSKSTGSYTATNPGGTWASKWMSTATDPQVTLSVGSNNIAVSTGYIYSGASGCTYTLTAQAGYLITGYTITGTAQSGAQTLTPAAGGSATSFATTGTTTLTVSGLSTQSTTFTQSTPNSGIAISSFTITLTEDPEFAQWEPSIADNAFLTVGEKVSSIETVTDVADNTKWYIVTQVRNGESPMYDAGVGTTLKRAAASVTPATLSETYAKNNITYLVRFFSAGNGLYNIQFANGSWIDGSLKTTASKGNAGTYAFYNSNGGSGSYFGWNLNSTSGSIVDNNGAGYTLSFWGSGTVSGTSGNNVWYVYETTVEVPASTVDVTYAQYVNGVATGVTHTETVMPNSSINVPANFYNGYASFAYNFTTEGTIGTEDVTIKVNIDKKPGLVESLTDLSNNKAYTLTCARGTYTTVDGSLANTVKNSAYSVNNFAIVSYEGNYYLWSVATSKFVACSGATLGDVPVAVTMANVGNGLFKFQGGNLTLNATGGFATGGAFDSWSTTDEGNSCAIIAAADFDPADVNAALEAYFHPATYVVYEVSDASGVVFTSEQIPATAGEVITELPDEYKRDYCEYSMSSYTVVEGENVVPVTVTVNMPFKASADYEHANWYTIHNANLNRYPYYDSADESFVPLTTELQVEDRFQWAFFGTPYGIRIINKAAGAGKYLKAAAGGNGNLISMSDTPSVFKVVAGTDANNCAFELDGFYVNDYSGNAKLSFWQQGPTSDAGSKWVVSRVSSDEINLAIEVTGATEAENSRAGKITMTLNGVSVKKYLNGADAEPQTLVGFIPEDFTAVATSYRGYDFTGFTVGEVDYGTSIEAGELAAVPAGSTLVAHYVATTGNGINLWYDYSDDMADAYRIPALIRTQSGRLIAFSDYRPGHADVGGGACSIERRYSDDNGETWSAALRVAQGRWGENPDNVIEWSFGDAAVVADNTPGNSGNDVMMICCGGNKSWPYSNYNPDLSQAQQGCVRWRSTDGGVTWSNYEFIMPGIMQAFADAGLSTITRAFFTSGKITQSSRKAPGAQYNRLYSALDVPNDDVVVYSDDFGETWAVLGDGIANTGDEAHVVELPDGDLLLVGRGSSSRYVNVFNYTDWDAGTGTWGAQGQYNNAFATSCNGDVEVIEAYNAYGDKNTVVVETAPMYSGQRRDIQYYYIAMPKATGFSTADFSTQGGASWTQGMNVSHNWSAYSSLLNNGDGTFDILFEDCAKDETAGPSGYCIVYQQGHDIKDITNNLYFFDKAQAEASGKKVPCPGHFYRFKGSASNAYITAGEAGAVTTTTATDASTIWYYGVDGLVSYATGRFLDGSTKAQAAIGTSYKAVVEPNGYYDGKYLIKTNGYYSYDKDSNNTLDRGSGYNDNERYAWTVEDVTTLPVTVKELGLATLYSPVGLTAPDDVKIYAATKNIPNGTIHFDQVEEVKADAGVLVEAAPGTYDFVVAPNEADYASDLVGSVATKATSSFANTVYTLQSGPAFMQYNGKNVTGFRSHIEVESAGVKAFDILFGEDATGIATSLQQTADGAAIYNVAGQRLSKVQKGINIINGKKILK